MRALFFFFLFFFIYIYVFHLLLTRSTRGSNVGELMSPTNALIKTVVIGFNSRTERLDNIPYVSDLGELSLQVINSG